jgi:glutathione S-transferase
MTITLYEVRESPHSRKVRLLAAELGIPLHTVACDPRIGETRSADFLAKNPNGKVPTLEEDGFVLWESPAILKYLAAKHPETGLGGRDAKTEAVIDQWLFWWVSGPEAAIDALAWELIIKPMVLKQPGNNPGIMADARARIDRSSPCSTGSSRIATTLSGRSALPISPSGHASTARRTCSNSTSLPTRTSPRG